MDYLGLFQFDVMQFLGLDCGWDTTFEIGCFWLLFGGFDLYVFKLVWGFEAVSFLRCSRVCSLVLDFGFGIPGFVGFAGACTWDLGFTAFISAFNLYWLLRWV